MNTRLSAVLRAGLIAYTAVVVLIIVPWTSVPTGDSKTAVLHGAAAIFGLLLCAGWLTRRLDIPRHLVFGAPMLLFAGINVAAGVFSEYPLNSLPALTRMGSLIILYLVAAVSMREVRHVRLWMIAASTAVALSCAYAISQRLGFSALSWDPVERSAALFDDSPGTFGNPNYAGHAIVLCAVFAAYLATQTRWAAILLAIYAVQLGLAMQRGALVAVAAAAVTVMLALGVKRIVAGPIRATFATIAAGLVVAAVGAAAVWSYATYRNGWTEFLDGSTILRYNAYASAAQMIRDRPLLGYGPDNYVIENAPYWTDYEQKWFVRNELMNQHVHSDLLEIGVDGGVLAAVVFLTIVVMGMGYGLRYGFEHPGGEKTTSRNLGFAASAFFIAFLVDGTFGFDFYVPVSASFFFIVAGGLDGVLAGSSAAAVGRRASRATAAVVFAAALAIAAVGLRTYAGKMASLDGRRAVATRHYAIADVHFAHAEHLQPWSWVIPYRRGGAAQLAGNLDDARAHFTRTLRKNPNYVPALTYLARLNLAEAHAQARKSPSDAASYLAEAESLARHALDLAPMRPDDLDVLGRVYFLMAAEHLHVAGPDEVAHAWAQSHTMLSQAIAQGRTPNAELWSMVAQSAVAAGLPEAAAQAFADAVALLPNEEQPYAAYYAFAEKSGQLPQFAAVLASQLVGARDPVNTALANRWLTRAMEQGLHDADVSWSILRVAIQSRPADPDLWAAFTDATRTETERAEFAALVGRMVKGGVTLPLTARIMGMAWSGERGALAIATKALIDAHAPKSSGEANGPIDIEYVALANRLETEVRRADNDVAGIAVAAINIAHIRVQSGQPELAAALLEERYATMTIPERMLAAGQYAEALLDAQRPEEAERLVRDLVTIDPIQAELRVLLARVLARAGKRIEAYEEYALLLAIPDLDAATRALLEQEQSALGQPQK